MKYIISFLKLLYCLVFGNKYKFKAGNNDKVDYASSFGHSSDCGDSWN